MPFWLNRKFPQLVDNLGIVKTRSRLVICNSCRKLGAVAYSDYRIRIRRQASSSTLRSIPIPIHIVALEEAASAKHIDSKYYGQRTVRHQSHVNSRLETLFTSVQASEPSSISNAACQTPSSVLKDGSILATSCNRTGGATETEPEHISRTDKVGAGGHSPTSHHKSNGKTSTIPPQSSERQRWEELQDLLDQRDRVATEDLWRYCSHVISTGDVSSLGPRKGLHPAQVRLLDRVLARICEGDIDEIKGYTVAPSTVISVYNSHYQTTQWYPAALWKLLGRALVAEHDSNDRKDRLSSRVSEHTCIMHEILHIWELFWPDPIVMPAAHPSDHSSMAIFIPDWMRTENYQSQLPQDLTSRFQKCLQHIRQDRAKAVDSGRSRPLARPSAYMRSLAAAAAMTKEHFARCRSMLESLPCGASYQQFLDFLDMIVINVHSEYEIARKSLSDAGVTRGLVAEALQTWELRKRPELSHSTGESTRARLSRRPLYESQDLKTRIKTYSGHLDEAVKQSNVDMAEQVWQEVQGLDGKKFDPDLRREMDKLYITLLSSFFALRRAEVATRVWNHMVVEGHLPNKVHWTAMLHGCIKAHDASSLQTIWNSMVKSNITPDTVTWTTYIRGLIKCRLSQEGINALDQLGRIWKKSVFEDAPYSGSKHSTNQHFGTEHLLPDLAPVNAALDALIDIERNELLKPLLAWARTHQLEPDTHTYNILLRPLARAGNTSAIAAHLSTMSAANCPPDVVTFTIIISSLVVSRNFTSLPSRDQEQLIRTLLEDMRNANVPPNTHTYSTLLTAILDPPSPNRQTRLSADPAAASEDHSKSAANIATARTVLAHMHASSVVPSPHIYTILISHYFSRQPADLEAVRSLWNSIRASPFGLQQVTDPIFYDRMIEGLAKAGEVDQAIDMVQRASAQGQMLSWVALGRLLESLETAKDGAKLSWLIEHVERKGGGQRDIRGQGFFMRKVEMLRETGLV